MSPQPPNLRPDQRYHRQLILPELGPQGQKRLATSRVLVVGCGGLGAPVVQYLAAAGVGHLALVDDDRVEASNLNRQVLHRTADVGRLKTIRAQECALELNPSIEVSTVDERVGVGNARELISAHDLTMDCTDGLPAKFLLNDACVLEDRPLVHGAVAGWAGQVLVVPGRQGPCLRCLFPNLPPRGMTPTCQQVGVLGSSCGFVGSLMVTEAIKVLAGIGKPLVGRWLSIDAMAPSFLPIDFEADGDCPTCGPEPRVDAETSDDYRTPPSDSCT